MYFVNSSAVCGLLPDDVLRNVSGQAVGDEAEEGAVPHPVLNTVVEDRAPTCRKKGSVYHEWDAYKKGFPNEILRGFGHDPIYFIKLFKKKLYSRRIRNSFLYKFSLKTREPTLIRGDTVFVFAYSRIFFIKQCQEKNTILYWGI